MTGENPTGRPESKVEAVAVFDSKNRSQDTYSFEDVLTVNGLGMQPDQKISTTLLLTKINTPLGSMIGVVDDRFVRLLEFADRRALPGELSRLGRITPGQNEVIAVLERQLRDYFSGDIKTFDLSILQHGTEFEEKVWSALLQIPCGETRSYGDVARAIGMPEMVREVGRANGANQISIIVPCHRVIGSDGSLTGYGGGLWRKKWLLEHEQKLAGKGPVVGSSQSLTLVKWTARA